MPLFGVDTGFIDVIEMASLSGCRHKRFERFERFEFELTSQGFVPSQHLTSHRTANMSLTSSTSTMNAIVAAARATNEVIVMLGTAKMKTIGLARRHTF